MIRGFQWDLARQVERFDWLIAQLPRYADWGYNELYLHLEDAIEYPSLRGIARKDAYSHRQMHRLIAKASQVGIDVVPIVNLLGHTQYLIKVPELRELNELVAPDGSPLEEGQICPVHPRTLEVANKLLCDVAPFCTAGKVHVGLDESFHLGKHPRSQAEIRRIGLAAHFAQYVGRLRELTRTHHLAMGMWADMLYFVPDAVGLLPKDVALYEWYYHSFTRRPRVELFNFRETNLGERLRARGMAYWGCPMNGVFRYEPMPNFQDRLENLVCWWRRCARLGATGFLVTSWEPSRIALELTTVMDAAAASLWLDAPDLSPTAMLERGFARVFGRRHARKSARLALACDRHPFSGYPRWEINSRWDVLSGREAIAPYRREEQHFAQLRAKATRTPTPLRNSIELRWCLAARDVLVRQFRRSLANHRPSVRWIEQGTLSDIRRLESALKTGLIASHAMWGATRAAGTSGPNEKILRGDIKRLRALRNGDPVFGSEWQLCYHVVNFAPAAQLVGVEQRLPDGSWQVRQACHTIEFQSRAARRRDGLRREHAAPVDWDGDPRHFPKLRLFVRGIGQVRIKDALLTNGRDTWRLWFRATILGRAASTHGLPKTRPAYLSPRKFTRT